MGYDEGFDDIEIEFLTPLEKEEEKTKEAPRVITIDEEDRYSRLRLIPWWDQEKLRKARVMVVGAGALGNEILKNLALLGVGNIFIIDMDEIENSNLSRSVLYRAKDEGRSKAETAANAVKEINPDINVEFFNGNIVYDLGLGVFRFMDVIIGGLDNREARLSINQSCWKVTKPWVDGAIEVLTGVARVFIPPHSSCYECTMNEGDYRALGMRRSCALLTRSEMITGKIPTTPTISSIIAGIQVQEAVKIIHNRESIPPMAGKGFVFNGATMDSYTVEYPRREDCYSHETYEDIIPLDRSTRDTTLGELLDFVRSDFRALAVLEFEREIVYNLRCEECGGEEPVFKALGRVTEEEGRCPVCGRMRHPEITHSIYGNEPFLNKTLSEIGIPLMDIVAAREGADIRYYEFQGDRRHILGSFE